MRPLSCFIVEDDIQALEYATNIVKDFDAITILGNAAHIKEAAVQVKKLKPDFVILDVFLEDGNAFEFLKLFETIDFRIIFTTSFADYAIDAFRFSALDYLLKPYEASELVTAIEKVEEDINKDSYQSQLQTLLHNTTNQKESKKIILKNSDAIFVVNVSEVLFAKSDNNYTTFYLKDGKEILVSVSLKSFEKKLSGNSFLRVHQSYLINLSYISSFNKKAEEVILDQSIAIPVAQSRKPQLMNFLSNLN